MENKLQELNEQVSFIVPVYNKSVEQFKLCLNSIISQNKFIKEILVMGLRLNSEKIMQQYQKKWVLNIFIKIIKE